MKRSAQSGFARHIRFVENYDPSLPPVLGNRDQLIQVILNLVKNAAEAIGADTVDGEITLSTAFRTGRSPADPGLARAGQPADRGGGARQRPRRPADLLPRPVRPLRDHQDARAPASVLHWLPRSSAITAVSSSAIPCPAAPPSAFSSPCRAPGMGATPSWRPSETHAQRPHPRRRRRRSDPHRPQPGPLAGGLRGPLHRQRLDAVALGRAGRGRPRHHRRGDARRERLRPPAPHQAGAARAADHRDERAEHLHDGDPRLRARGLRIPAQALRPEGADRHRRSRPVAAPAARPRPAPSPRTRTSRWSAARRPCRRSTGRWRG